MCGVGNDFYSPKKQQHGGISTGKLTINGSLYTQEHPQCHDAYVGSQEQNGTQVDDIHSEQSGVVNTTENMPPLCSLQELDMAAAQADESNAKRVVKSLLRAMLAKPRLNNVSSLMELTTKTEFDSGSEDTAEQALVGEQAQGGDGKDEDSQSDTVARDDGAAMESETDLSTTAHNWPSSALSSPEKSSRCPYCLKMFRYRSSYRRHVKIHEGIFSHECTICLRKFTRKEHYVRHKCDRRPNKPYNVTHEAFRRMSAGQKPGPHPAVKSALSRDALAHSVLSRFDGCTADQQLEAPLELTCQSQSTGKQLDVPKLLFSGGSVSTSTVPPVSMDSSSYPVCVTSVSAGLHSSEHMIGILPHNESRRKSSTPRKVVTAGSDATGTIESDSCRPNFPGGLNNLKSVSVID